MKQFFVLLVFLLVSMTVYGSVFAEVATSPNSFSSPLQEAVNPGTAIPYNQNGEYGLDQGREAVANIGGINTEVSASQFIQDIIIYLLSFISLIAVIYIIYAGFQILIGNGEEEKLKKSKQTILYVIIGIFVIWLAYPITTFVIGALQ